MQRGPLILQVGKRRGTEEKQLSQITLESAAGQEL